MEQSGPSTAHFPTYTYAYPNGQVPLSPLPKQLFSPPTEPFTAHSSHSHHPSPHPLTSAPPPQPQAPVGHESEPLHQSQTRLESEAKWAIWSRRPQDPSHAPGVIISSNAKPPPYIVQHALDLPTPPPSPVLSTQDLPENNRPLSPGYTTGPIENAPEPASSSTVPSSNVTELADHDTPAHVSPDSSMTSLSTSMEALAKSPDSVDTSSANIVAESTRTHQPQPPAPPTPKKSWAALLQSSSPSSSVSPGQKRLPTSTVVGISIPASTPLSGSSSQSSQPTFSHPALLLPHTKRTELLSLLTAVPDASPGVSKIRPRGLVNAGNMCFANSVLQVLVYCPPFHKLFTELGRYGFGVRSSSSSPSSSSEKDGKGPTPLVDAMVEFVREFSGAGKEKISRGKGKERDDENRDAEETDDEGSFLPSYVFDAMKEKTVFDGMRSGQQEDAEEFLGFFLDALEEELLAVVQALSGSSGSSSYSTNTAQKKAKVKSSSSKGGAGGIEEREAEEEKEDGWLEVGKRNRMVVTRTIKAAETPITRIFGGKVRSTLKNPGHKDSVTVESWRALRLDIQPDSIGTLSDALSHMAAPQTLELDSAGAIRQASIQHLLEALPPVLVVHLKRFCYDKDVGGVVKIGKGVRWGEELEVGGEVLAPALRRGLAARYRLFGVVYHHGPSASGGHYTLDVFHPTQAYNQHSDLALNGWMRIDDELVSDIRPNDVFAPDHEEEELQGKAAYLLFYRRVR